MEGASRKRFLLFVLTVGAALLAFSQANAVAAGTGSISGNVTDIAGDPVTGVCAQAFDSDGDGLNSVSTDETDNDGNYTLDGLDTGSYRVRFLPCAGNVLREWFDDKETFAGATPVPVTDGSDTPGIDAELATGGSISGRVLNAPGGSNLNTCVEAYGTDGTDSDYAQSDADGDYRLGGLETGQYRVGFSRCGADENVAREFYPDKGTRDEATLVTVTAGSDTPGIDAQLEEGATISGIVSSGGPSFAPYACSGKVRVLDAGGDIVVTDDSFGFSSATVGGSDSYKLERLKPGNEYRLSADLFCGWFPPSPDSYAHVEYYRDRVSLATATPISVVTGSALTGIDIDLDSPDPALVAPDTVIDSGPSGTITADEATFAFSSTDPANTAGFECSIDSGDFADCTSPMTFASLSEGPHTVAFRAEHAVAGNEDQSPATRTFTVDTSGPTVRKARISKVSVKGPAKVTKGRKAAFRVKIRNSGNARATGVRVTVKGRAIKLTRQAGTIQAGTTKTVKVKLKFRTPGSSKITFRVTSENAGSKAIKRAVIVKK